MTPHTAHPAPLHPGATWLRAAVAISDLLGPYDAEILLDEPGGHIVPRFERDGLEQLVEDTARAHQTAARRGMAFAIDDMALLADGTLEVTTVPEDGPATRTLIRPDQHGKWTVRGGCRLPWQIHPAPWPGRTAAIRRLRTNRHVQVLAAAIPPWPVKGHMSPQRYALALIASDAATAALGHALLNEGVPIGWVRHVVLRLTETDRHLSDLTPPSHGG